MFIPIPFEIQNAVKNESSLTGKSIRQIITDKLRQETAEKIYSKDLLANLQKLNEIQKLPKNWNGNGASRFSKKLINKVKELLFELNKQPQVFPTANDSIQIEYNFEDGSYLEFQISKLKLLEFLKITKDGSETSGTIPCSHYYINQMLEEFYE
ncbi:hypothetical protein [Treponema sp. C6A8]|uniref:hypothetical protein n=1 Tax=Treponema sp. C6A8 TaxID=1410609 RepID=UPI000688AA87|nr:hypothetical protein [Treponema sp. C6A8]